MSRFFHQLRGREAIDNPSTGPSLGEVIESRRRLLQGAAAALGTRAAAALAGGALPAGTTGFAGLMAAAGLAGCAGGPGAGVLPGGGGAPGLGFKAIPIARDDALHVPEGYTATVLYRWGDPVGDTRGLPAFRMDAGNSAEEQLLQAGMHHDGMFFFPMSRAPMKGRAARSPADAGSDHGLLVMNHEYVDHGLLFPDGDADWSIAKVRKSQSAVGVSIVEVRRAANQWALVRPSPMARRIHANTPMRIAGPAAGDPSMRTSRSPEGIRAWGTFANCANGWTPWGTYLTCEENFHAFFRGRDKPTAREARYGLGRGDSFRWGELDGRFDVERNPNEPNHFGWVVEIDPFDPVAMPVKRTAMGRKKQEGAAPAICADGRVAFYMGDDQAFEYLYKFVTARAWNPDDRAANRDLLDQGTLYVARFEADGSGRWVELVHGRNGLTQAAGFASQAEVLINARAAADAAGGTRLDRPEWTAVDPVTGAVYVSLTHNVARGAAGRPGVDAVNPRAANRYGQIVRFAEDGSDAAATGFRWELFAMGGERVGDPRQAGDPLASPAAIRGDLYAAPDGLLVDARGVLWVQTDFSTGEAAGTDGTRLGNNAMLAVDPVTRETRRFLTGPRGCEITGACLTPDGTTMFVNVQHPGEGRRRGQGPREVSNWPDQQPDGRPRSSTVVIRRTGGGVIGAP